MSAMQFPDKYKKVIIPFLLSNVYFLSIEHHAIKFWEQPGRVMLGLWVVFVPLLTGALFLLFKRYKFEKIGKTQLVIFLLPALLISTMITWQYYNVPKTFHTITISPLAVQDQKIQLIEIKANGNVVLPNEKNALKNRWEVTDGLLVATSSSQPIAISFAAEINSPVTVLFYGSPQSGKAQISLESEQVELDLKSPEESQKTSAFLIRSYRGIPNWLFIPFLLIVDIFSICSLFLFIFHLQETAQRKQALSGTVITNHRRNLIILLAISCALHLLNSLAVPLILDEDSPTYLRGAIHLLEYGNPDVDSTIVRGPVSALLLAPVVFLFGRNPWGIKILLHLLGIACVPLAYRIGWQISKNQWAAFISGLVTALSPDLFIYSNFLMSDLPNIFFVLVFCTLLLSALETFEFRWVFATMLMGSVATLFRSENVTLLLIGSGALFVSYLWQWKTTTQLKLRPMRDFSLFCLSLIVAALPILGWSAHNQKVYGFFGLSNYASEIFYDGWIYFGDASGLGFTDQGSQAVQTIQAAVNQYPITVTDKKGVPTGWEVYPSLIKSGYTMDQSFNLMKQATTDSIKKDWELTYKLLLIKIKAGLKPETTHMLSFPLPGESARAPKMGFFDEEKLSIPTLILAQRKAYEYMQKWYDSFFPLWMYLCLASLFFSLYRSPQMTWWTLIAITVTRIFIPNIMGLSHWRYTLAGLVPLQIVGVCWLAAIIQGGASFFNRQTSIEVE